MGMEKTVSLIRIGLFLTRATIKHLFNMLSYKVLKIFLKFIIRATEPIHSLNNKELNTTYPQFLFVFHLRLL